jgi:hypothetical protein
VTPRLVTIASNLAGRHRRRTGAALANAFKLVARTLLQCRCPREEPMVDRANPTWRALELARPATPATSRRRTALAAVARPAAEVAGLLLVEVLRSPRARTAALSLARSLAGWLAGRCPNASARAEVTTGRVTVVKDAVTGVVVHRVETALVVRTPGVVPRLARRR